ncbi:MAG: ATP-binding cassette domain-containing protein [Sphingobacteriales bacterium]|nr:ATP-binding cassette domain-containing protein [Sphingobacteriales bacterium]
MTSTNPPTVIELKNAIIAHRSRVVLDNVNFTVNEGQLVYVLGRTGTGKSSLLRTLYGDLSLAGGFGKVAGFTLEHLNWQTRPYLRRKMGIVFQDFQLLHDRTVEANLRFALEATDWRDQQLIANRIAHALANVAMLDKRQAMPYQLSGGEQQRVAFARALLNNPALIIADEPTGNLDPQSAHEIFELLFQICRQTTTTIVVGTHDYANVQRFKGVVYNCANGKLSPMAI